MPQHLIGGDTHQYQYADGHFQYVLTTFGPIGQSGTEMVHYGANKPYWVVWNSFYRWDAPKIPINIRARGEENGFVREAFDYANNEAHQEGLWVPGTGIEIGIFNFILDSCTHIGNLASFAGRHRLLFAQQECGHKLKITDYAEIRKTALSVKKTMKVGVHCSECPAPYNNTIEIVSTRRYAGGLIYR